MREQRCSCGWRLPLSVIPIRREALLGEFCEDNIVPGVAVALLCPECERAHSFIQPHEARAAGLEIKT